MLYHFALDAKEQEGTIRYLRRNSFVQTCIKETIFTQAFIRGNNVYTNADVCVINIYAKTGSRR